MVPRFWRKIGEIGFGLSLLGLCHGCVRNEPPQRVLQVKGSDTMVNLAQAWAEAYRKASPGSAAVAVTGGGSGTGIAALLKGTADIANSSRPLKPDEKTKAKEDTGKEVVGSVVALDALAVFVHKDNPLNEITIDELSCLYGEGGHCEKWSDINHTVVPGCQSNEVLRVGRQSNSGTYQYFREAVVGEKRALKLGSREMNGSKEVVDLVEKTQCSIGYSGMGFLTPKVKAICVSKGKGLPCVAPSAKSVLDKTYPLARELYMYTLGTQTVAIKAFLSWVKGPQGQKLVQDLGYVPFPQDGKGP
jgi:phosphate transport system substrate-binding protein